MQAIICRSTKRARKCVIYHVWGVLWPLVTLLCHDPSIHRRQPPLSVSMTGVFTGTANLLGKIRHESIDHNLEYSISQENAQFLKSLNLMPIHPSAPSIFVPGSIISLYYLGLFQRINRFTCAVDSEVDADQRQTKRILSSIQ